jgi:hypothetical protein
LRYATREPGAAGLKYQEEGLTEEKDHDEETIYRKRPGLFREKTLAGATGESGETC